MLTLLTLTRGAAIKARDLETQHSGRGKASDREMSRGERALTRASFNF